MVIFYSYVSLPEGIENFTGILCFFQYHPHFENGISQPCLVAAAGGHPSPSLMVVVGSPVNIAMENCVQPIRVGGLFLSLLVVPSF